MAKFNQSEDLTEEQSESMNRGDNIYPEYLPEQSNFKNWHDSFMLMENTSCKIPILAIVTGQENGMMRAIMCICPREMLIQGIYMREYTPEYLALLIKVSEQEVIDLFDTNAFSIDPKESYKRVIDHLALQPTTKEVFETHQEQSFGLIMYLDAELEDDTMVEVVDISTWFEIAAAIDQAS